MLDSQNLLSGKGKYLVGCILLLLVTAICAAFRTTASDHHYAMARREVLLRRIGHELLLQSGDSTSRVLPVKKLDEQEYQISFEHELTFQADSLVNTTRRILAKDSFASDYVVKVRNIGQLGVAYGYAISKNKKDNIVTCIGRKLPKARYVISIQFKPTVLHPVKTEVLLGGLPLLAFVGFIFLRFAKPRKPLADNSNTGMVALGSALFDTQNRKLIIQGNPIDLTRTETRVLLLFALSPNETIERSRLQKEVWEDEGVIVGRSLDMFISKLRKKLEGDPNINLIVVRSKGYKLELTS